MVLSWKPGVYKYHLHFQDHYLARVGELSMSDSNNNTSHNNNTQQESADQEAEESQSSKQT
jgi:hypothetical protein